MPSRVFNTKKKKQQQRSSEKGQRMGGDRKGERGEKIKQRQLEAKVQTDIYREKQKETGA